MDDLLNVLKSNVKQFLNSARIVYKTKDYTSAAILFFKALFCICDLLILKKKGVTPKNHTERFAMLSLDFEDVYNKLSGLFELYRQTYFSNISEKDCNEVKAYAEELFKRID